MEQSPDFTLKTTSEELRNLVDAVVVVVGDEATFNLSKETITLRQMGPERVTMVDLNKPAERFKEYEVRQPGKICLNINELMKILRRCGKEDEVTLQTNLKTGKLEISIEFLEKSKERKGTFTIPTLEPYEEEVPIPKVEFTTRWKGETEVLQAAFEDTALVSDHVKVITLEDGLRLKAGEDLIQAEVELRKSHDATLDFFNKAPEAEKVISSFSLGYLTEIVKVGCRLSTTVTFEYSKDMPSKIQFQDVAYYLAPRIEVE